MLPRSGRGREGCSGRVNTPLEPGALGSNNNSVVYIQLAFASLPLSVNRLTLPAHPSSQTFAKIRRDNKSEAGTYFKSLLMSLISLLLLCTLLSEAMLTLGVWAEYSYAEA